MRSSNGISAGVGVGNTGAAVGPGSVSGTGGVSPMTSQNENGDSSATTRSAISAGTVNITNPGAQTQDVANLSRDTTNTNGTVANTPDVQNILSQQADTMQAAQAAGQVVAQGIGAYADHKQATATDAATADAWAEGGTDRVALHIAGGALIGGLGGGTAFSTIGGAAGAGISSALAPKLNGLADSIGTETGSMTVGNTVSNVLAGLSGAVVGGSAGAATASNADLYNRQLHPDEKTLAKQLADESGGKYTQAQIEDQMRIMGVSANGTNESGAPTTLIGQAPTDSGAQWMSARTTANGQPILTQMTAQADPALQSYILANYNSASPGQVPSQFTYTQSSTPTSTGSQGIVINTAGTICPNGNCGLTNGSVQMPTQQQLADAAGNASAQLGVASATAAAIASYTADKPYVAGTAETFSLVTGAASFAFGGLQQALAPNVGQYFTEGTLIGLAGYYAGDRYPLLGPVISQAGNMLPNAQTISNFESLINSKINSVLNKKNQ